MLQLVCFLPFGKAENTEILLGPQIYSILNFCNIRVKGWELDKTKKLLKIWLGFGTHHLIETYSSPPFIWICKYLAGAHP